MSPDDGALQFDESALATVARLRSRFRGALLGLAVGDALAAPVQYARAGSFPPVRDLLGGGPYDLPRGSWTDDTALAILVARSLLERGICDPLDQLARFKNWQRSGEGSATGECLGITASVSRALVDGEPSPQIADGADALVRVAPLALWHYADAALMQRDLPVMCRVTSHESATVLATAEFSKLLQQALRGAALAPLATQAAETAVAATNASVRTLAVVRRSIFGATSFKEAVLRAVNEGGDADVYGAATGQLAGAAFGVDGIPSAWLSALAQRDAIEELADGLLTEVLIRLDEG